MISKENIITNPEVLFILSNKYKEFVDLPNVLIEPTNEEVQLVKEFTIIYIDDELKTKYKMKGYQ